MVSFRDLVESMERDTTVKEYTVVISDPQPHTRNPEFFSNIKQEANPKWKNNIIPQSLQDVKKDQAEAKKNKINNHENKKLSQITNTHNKSKDDRRPSEETVEYTRRRTSGYEGAVLEGTGQQTQPLNHARGEYVAAAMLKQQLPLSDQACLHNEQGFPVKNEDSKFEEQGLSSHLEFQHTHQNFLSHASESREAGQEFVAQEREFQEANQEFVAHESEFKEADQEFVTHEDEFQEADQEFVAHESEFQEADQEFVAHESEFQEADQEFVAHESEFQEADQEFVAQELEFQQADQEFVAHEREFQHPDQEFVAHEHLFQHANQELLSKEQDPQQRSIVKEECSTLIKEEKMDDSDSDATEELMEQDTRHAPLPAVTEPTWMTAYTPYHQQINFLTSFSPSVGHSRLQCTHPAGLSHLGRSSTTSTANASKVSHPTYAPVMYGRGSRPLSSTSFNNTVHPLQDNFSNTKGNHRGNRGKFLQDRWTGASSMVGRVSGGGAQCWARGGREHRSWAMPEAPKCRQAPCRSAESSVSACRHRGLGTASTRGVTGHVSETVQATRGWRHAMPVKNGRGVQANAGTQERRNATGVTLRGTRSSGEEPRHILAASGPHLLTTHTTQNRNDHRTTTQDRNDLSSTTHKTEESNDLCSRHQPRNSRESTTNNLRQTGGCERQGGGTAAGAGQQGATARAGAGQQWASAVRPLPYPTQASSPTFRCEVCEITRRDAGSLARHWRLHAPGRPFACPYCPSRFNQLVHLQIHRRTHTGEKPFRCTTCGSRFSRKDRLRCHERSHSGERPYPCPDCEATFRDVATLKVHLASHTHHTTYTCRLCQATFAQLSTFTSHWRKQHNWGKDIQEYT